MGTRVAPHTLSHFAPQLALSGESKVHPEFLRSPFPEKIRRALNVKSETEDLCSAVSGIMSEHDHKDAFGARLALWFILSEWAENWGG